jgi:hypothetical protein
MLLPETSQPLAASERQPSKEEDHVRRAAVNDHPSHGRRAMVGSRKAAQVSAKLTPVDNGRRATAAAAVGPRVPAADSELKAAAVVGHTRVAAAVVRKAAVAVAVVGPRVAVAVVRKAAAVAGPRVAEIATRAADASATRVVVGARPRTATRPQQRRLLVARCGRAARWSCRPR